MNGAQATNQQTNNATADTSEQQAPQQQLNAEQSNVSKLTPEQEEEAKLRIKYPNPQKPGIFLINLLIFVFFLTRK